MAIDTTNISARMINPTKQMKCILDDGEYRIVGEVASCSIDMGGPFDRTEYEIRMFPSLTIASGSVPNSSRNCKNKSMKAQKVIFNPPATIVLWEDKTKTVVKCDQDDTFDEMKGLALCYMKKALGNTSRELNKALRKGAKHEDN